MLSWHIGCCDVIAGRLYRVDAVEEIHLPKYAQVHVDLGHYMWVGLQDTTTTVLGVIISKPNYTLLCVPPLRPLCHPLSWPRTPGHP